MHMLQILAECRECKKVWEDRNAMGVAARHNQATGHEVAIEVTYSHRFKGPKIERAARKKKAKA